LAAELGAAFPSASAECARRIAASFPKPETSR
jgi:hypothetical protein